MIRISVFAALLGSLAAIPAAAGPSDTAAARAHQTPAAGAMPPGQADGWESLEAAPGNSWESPAEGSGSATTVGSGAAVDDSGTVGTAGSAAAGGTSASSLDLGATSTGEDGETSSVLGTGGSAASAGGGNVQSRTQTVENPNMIQGQSRAQAVDRGTFSRSHTRTRVRHGDELESTTRSMSHVPGERPAMSTTTEDVQVR